MAAASLPDKKSTSSSSSSEEGSLERIQRKTSADKSEFVGNVSNYTPVPEGYKGQLSKGHLIFDACFEAGTIELFSNMDNLLVLTGNLGRVDYISHFEYDLFVRPDTCNPK